MVTRSPYTGKNATPEPVRCQGFTKTKGNSVPCRLNGAYRWRDKMYCLTHHRLMRDIEKAKR
jgi:hypothetical protein